VLSALNIPNILQHDPNMEDGLIVVQFRGLGD
jgi:hypothetical protein